MAGAARELPARKLLYTVLCRGKKRKKRAKEEFDGLSLEKN